jgi:hypothetical protein
MRASRYQRVSSQYFRSLQWEMHLSMGDLLESTRRFWALSREGLQLATSETRRVPFGSPNWWQKNIRVQ